MTTKPNYYGFAAQPQEYNTMRTTTNLIATTLLTACALLTPTACMAPPPYHATENLPRLSVPADYQGPAKMAGQIPLETLLKQLQVQHLLMDWPSKPETYSVSVVINPGDTLYQVIQAIEVTQAWTYDFERHKFYNATATHLQDSPSPSGQALAPTPVRLSPRGMLCVSIRFTTGDATIDKTQIGASAQMMQLDATVPAGVNSTWQSTSNRAYTNGIQNSQTGVTVNTTTNTVSAGLTYQGIAATIPGMMMRINGTLTVSSFTGITGLDTNNITVPIDVDAPRCEWIPIFRFITLDANAALIFKRLGLSLGAGASIVTVSVKVQ